MVLVPLCLVCFVRHAGIEVRTTRGGFPNEQLFGHPRQVVGQTFHCSVMKYFNRLFESRSFKGGGIIHHFFDTVTGQRIDVAGPGHPINDHHQMANIDVGTVERKDSMDFFQERRSCCFNPVGGPNGKDVVALDSGMVNGLQLFEKVQIDPFGVDDKLCPLCSDTNFGNVFRTFDGGVQYHFGVFEKIVFGPHVQVDIVDQIIVVRDNDVFPDGSHPRDNVVQINVVLHHSFPTQ